MTTHTHTSALLHNQDPNINTVSPVPPPNPFFLHPEAASLRPSHLKKARATWRGFQFSPSERGIFASQVATLESNIDDRTRDPRADRQRTSEICGVCGRGLTHVIGPRSPWVARTVREDHPGAHAHAMSLPCVRRVHRMFQPVCRACCPGQPLAQPKRPSPKSE